MTIFPTVERIILHVPVRNELRCETLSIWKVIRELVSLAEERESKRVTMSEIGKELKAAGEDNTPNVQDVYKSLIDLGYQVGV